MQVPTESLPLPATLIDQLKQTEQNPRYHAEGNVYNHTLLVLDAYQAHKQAFELDKSDQEVLYWACILHDLGKITTTQWHQNRWRSKGHEKAGVSMARDILLQHPEINTKQRHRILDLVRYHSIPLQWGLHQQPIEAYKRLATKTDLRLLGIFAFFDIMGRRCEHKPEVLAISERFIEQVTPQVHYELGIYEDLLSTYRQAGLRHQNALWHALKFEDISLLEKLRAAKPTQHEKPQCELIMTLACPGSQKATYLDEQYGQYARFNLDQIDLSFDYETPHQRAAQLRQVKHFVSVYAQAKRNMIINGHFLSEDARQFVSSFARQLNVRIVYLFFEESLERLLQHGTTQFSEATIKEAYRQHMRPHPWEAHDVITAF